MIAQLAIGFLSGLLLGTAVFSHAFSQFSRVVIGMIVGIIIGAVVDAPEEYVRWATYLPAEMSKFSAFWIGLIGGIIGSAGIWSERYDVLNLARQLFPPHLDQQSRAGEKPGVRTPSPSKPNSGNGVVYKHPAASDAVPLLLPDVVAADQPMTAWIDDTHGLLALGSVYKFYVDVGALYRTARTKLPARRVDWGEYQELDLLVILSTSDFDILPRQRSLRLAKSGDAEPVQFAIMPLVAPFALLRLSIYLAHDLSLLEEFEIPIDVEGNGDLRASTHQFVSRKSSFAAQGQG